MESFFVKNRSKKEKVTLVATVDEHSLVFVFVRHEGEKYTVVKYGTRLSGSYPGTFLLEDIFDEFQGKFSIKDLVISFAAPYFEIQSTIQSVRRVSGADEISKQEQHEIENIMAELAERQLRSRLFEDSGILPSDYTLQGISVFRWKIDGYSVLQPEGFKGQEVQGSVLGTFLREDYTYFVARIKKKYNLKIISTVHPFESIQRRGNRGVYLYITEKKTQGLIADKENFGLTESFSPGGNRFRDVFQEEFGMVENIAEEFEEKYIQEDLSEEVRARVHSFLLPEVYNFGTLVREKLEILKIYTPSDMFVFGGDVRFKEFFQMFTGPNTNISPFKETPVLTLLLPKDIEDVITFPDGIGSEYTPIRLILEEYYAKKTH